MKQILFLLIMLLLFYPSSNYSQELSEIEKLEIIGELDSTNEWIRHDAIVNIIQHKITEAIPKLIAMIWSDPEVRRSYYLWALSKLNYPDIIPLAYRFIDSIHTFRSYFNEKDILEYKVEATSALFEHGDYSTAHFIFALRDSNTVFGNSITLDLLPDVIRHVPQYEQRAKEDLIQIAFSNTKDMVDMFRQNQAIRYLIELYGQEYLDEVAQVFINSENTSVKLLIMEIFEKENYEGIRELYSDQLAQDTSTIVQSHIIETLLTKWGSPTLSFEIEKNIAGIANQKKKDILDFTRLNYKPPRPDKAAPIINLIDLLRVYTDECFDFGWIKDESYYLYLKELIERAEQFISASDSVNCTRQLGEFQKSIKEVYSDSAGSHPSYVSLDAQRFIYFYPQYILDRLLKIPETKTNEK